MYLNVYVNCVSLELSGWVELWVWWGLIIIVLFFVDYSLDYGVFFWVGWVIRVFDSGCCVDLCGL